MIIFRRGTGSNCADSKGSTQVTVRARSRRYMETMKEEPASEMPGRSEVQVESADRPRRHCGYRPRITLHCRQLAYGFMALMLYCAVVLGWLGKLSLYTRRVERPAEIIVWSRVKRRCLQTQLATQKAEEQQDGGNKEEQLEEAAGPHFDLEDPVVLSASPEDTNTTTSENNSPLEVAAAWCALVEAGFRKGKCPSKRCTQGEHAPTENSEFGLVMSKVEGVSGLPRPSLINPDGLWPANSLDFASTLQSYFPLFRSSLFARGMLEPDTRTLDFVRAILPFLDAVEARDTRAGMYLSPYHDSPEVKEAQLASTGYETILTVVGMTDMYITKEGFVFNEKDHIVPKSCHTAVNSASMSWVPKRHPTPYAQVFVMAQHWGDGYFHFIAESLPRMTVMLDILHAYPDIKIAVHTGAKARKRYMKELVELLGLDPHRLVFVDKQIHADLVFLPESTACGQPNTAMVTLLRSALLKGLYPATGGVPPQTQRPVILLIVRSAKRTLGNNDEVRRALTKAFPSHEVVEFLGEGSMRSQLKLFSNAAMIVAPHGAGLTNMVVSPLHTPVLEIGPPSCPTCYVHMTLKLQHVYARHLAGLPWDAPCESTYWPDVEEIIAIASDLLEAKKQADAADPPKLSPP